MGLKREAIGTWNGKTMQRLLQPHYTTLRVFGQSALPLEEGDLDMQESFGVLAEIAN